MLFRSVEAEPAEREDEGAGDRHREVVAGHRDRVARLGELADPRADDDGAGRAGGGDVRKLSGDFGQN